jgi:glycosyltransferase involved in cell wall biosynthesis
VKITVIGNGWSPQQAGGLNRYVTSVSNALADLGVAQNVLVLGPASERVVPGVVAVAAKKDSLLRRIDAFRQAIKRYAPESDLIVTHFALNATPLLLSRHSTPLVVHFHGPWADESRAMGENRISVFLKALIERLVYQRAVGFVTLSDAFKSVLVKSYGVDPTRVAVIDPGVDLTRFGEQFDQMLPQENQTLLCVRRLVPRMGLEVLIRAWARVNHAGWRLQIVGSGPQLENLESLVQDLRLSDSVCFEGYVPDDQLAFLYAAATASIIPSIELEGFGLVALESLAAGTPVLATNTGGLGEFLSRFSPDLLVAPNDVDKLAEKMQLVIQKVIPLPEQEACQSFAAMYSWTEVARKLTKQYETCAQTQA